RCTFPDRVRGPRAPCATIARPRARGGPNGPAAVGSRAGGLDRNWRLDYRVASLARPCFPGSRDLTMRATIRFLPSATRCAAVLGGLLGGSRAGRAQGPAPAGRSVVSDIIVQGNRLLSAEQIKVQLKTRVGADYSPAVLQEDVRSLYATHQFGNITAD